MLVFFAETDFLVFDFQAVQKIRVDISTVFVDEQVVAIVRHRIFVWLLAVRFLQELWETEAFWRNGLVELKIEGFLPQRILGNDSDFSQVIGVQCVIIHEIQAIPYPFLLVVGQFFKEIVITISAVTFGLDDDFFTRGTKR